MKPPVFGRRTTRGEGAVTPFPLQSRAEVAAQTPPAEVSPADTEDSA